MTAEVVVMNKSAIALAADSKVTIGGSRMSKTYDTVNKLFTLSKVHPVGIMIYGNADFMQYPWETLIKLYRSQRGDTSESSIAEWAADFRKYVIKFGNVSAENKRRNLREVVRSSFASVMDEADNASVARGITAGSTEYIDLLKSVFSDRISDIVEKDKWLSDRAAAIFIKKHGSTVDDLRDEVVAGFKDADLIKIADQFISCAILFKDPSPLSSGIVIGGFGDDEYFPAVAAMECDGYIGDTIKLYEDSVVSISRDMTGAMRAFAQGEMVQRFMTGLDPMLGSAIMTAFAEVMKENCLEILDKYGSVKNKTGRSEEEIIKAVHASMGDLLQKVQDYTIRAYSRPIIEMVSLLPRDELANLAESLVALTSLKRRVSHDLETVGGAIDVAVISKSDGFVWIKRKHYFHQDINPQFNRNYLNDIYRGVQNAESGSENLRRRSARKVENASASPKGRTKRKPANQSTT